MTSTRRPTWRLTCEGAVISGGLAPLSTIVVHAKADTGKHFPIDCTVLLGLREHVRVKIRRGGMQERTLPPSWAGYTAPWHHQRGPTCLTVHTVSRLCVPVFSVSDHIRESAPECFATPRRRRLDPRTTDRGHLSTAASDVGAITPFSFILHTYGPSPQIRRYGRPLCRLGDS